MADEPVIIPIPDTGGASFDETIALDGTKYLLRFDWHAREDRWYLDVYTEAGARVYVGMKILPGWTLGFRCASDDFPPGVFVTAAAHAPDIPPRLHELGRRVSIGYFPRG